LVINREEIRLEYELSLEFLFFLFVLKLICISYNTNIFVIRNVYVHSMIYWLII